MCVHHAWFLYDLGVNVLCTLQSTLLFSKNYRVFQYELDGLCDVSYAGLGQERCRTKRRDGALWPSCGDGARSGRPGSRHC